MNEAGKTLTRTSATRVDPTELARRTRVVLDDRRLWAARRDGAGKVHGLTSECPAKAYDVDVVDLTGERCWCSTTLPLAARVAASHADLVTALVEKVMVVEDSEDAFARYAALQEVEAAERVLDGWPVGHREKLEAMTASVRRRGTPCLEDLLAEVDEGGQDVVVLYRRRQGWGGWAPNWAEYALTALGADGDAGLVVVGSGLWEALRRAVEGQGGRVRAECAGTAEGLDETTRETMLQLWLDGCSAGEVRELSEAL